MKTVVRITVLVAALVSLPANAALFEISYPELDVVHAVISDIDAVEDRVYTLVFNEDGTAEIQFGDGVSGASPPSGGDNVIASYRFGDGVDGKIVNEYRNPDQQFPFIPIEDFWPAGASEPGASFVIIGLTSLSFDFSPDGLRVTDAQALPALVPAPPALLLFLTGLLGLAGLRSRSAGRN